MSSPLERDWIGTAERGVLGPCIGRYSPLRTEAVPHGRKNGDPGIGRCGPEASAADDGGGTVWTLLREGVTSPVSDERRTRLAETSAAVFNHGL